MKQITINTYSASELKEVNLKGFERAHNKYIQQTIDYGIAWGNEIMESLKGLIKATDGISLRDWSIDGSNPSQSYIKLTWDNDEARDLYGTRAMAWLENNLFHNLRIEFQPYGRVDKEHHWKSKRALLAKYGKFYRAGMIKPCPFTGVCFDEDFLESLQNDIKNGETLGLAFENLACKAGELIELEYEDQMSESYFIDHSDANGWMYDIDGHLM